MSALGMVWHMAAERFVPGDALERHPEPSAVMHEIPQVESFAASGGEQGLLRALQTFHAVQSMLCIADGASVLDLGCGPGMQLITVAKLHPSAHFLGIDLSRAMLERAEVERQRVDLPNVSFQLGDMTQLQGFANGSFDAVMCTMTLHHLLGTPALGLVLGQVCRLLKPGGGLYLTDFGRLKRDATVRYLVHDRAAEQTPCFTRDFENSMRAAFSVDEINVACQRAGLCVESHGTALAPFIWIRRISAIDTVSYAAASRARKLLADLSQGQWADFQALAAWFRVGGMGWPMGFKPQR